MPTAVIAAVGLLLILATTALNRGGEADASAGAPKGSAAEPENTKDQVSQFRALAGSPGHPYVVDTTGQLTQKYEITSLDSTVVIGPGGEVLGRADSKPMKTEALRTFLDKTLP